MVEDVERLQLHSQLLLQLHAVALNQLLLQFTLLLHQLLLRFTFQLLLQHQLLAVVLLLLLHRSLHAADAVATLDLAVAEVHVSLFANSWLTSQFAAELVA